MWEFYRSEQKVSGHEMENLLRNTDSTSITTMFPDSGPTYFSPQGTSRTLDHWITDHMVEECGVLWQTGRRLQLSPAGLPRDHVLLQPQTARAGIRWDVQSIADCLQKGDKRVEFLQAVDSSFEKAKPRSEALRKNPTPDRALWVDCKRETAKTFFALHRRTEQLLK